MSDKKITVKIDGYFLLFAIFWTISMIFNKCTIEGEKYPSTIAVIGAEYESMKTDFEKGREIYRNRK